MPQSIVNILLIILGSGLGGASRYGLSKWIQDGTSSGFPFGTLTVNIIGCLLLGIFYALLDKGIGMSNGLKLFLTVGFCGGFTTFSTFINDNWLMLNDNRFLLTLLYLLISVAGGYLFLYAGYRLVNYLL